MPTDCQELSPAAQAIFAKLKPFFPPDPWKRPCWFDDGRVIDNGEHDLRKAADRKNRKEWYQHMVGFSLTITAKTYQQKLGSLDDFPKQEKALEDVRGYLELIILIEELDFQIETGDFVDHL